MTKAQARERIEKLKKSIDRYRYEYHVLDRQSISDAAHDSLKHELYALEQQYPELITPDSPTQRVGGEQLPKFDKVKHAAPMLSMEDVFAPKEFDAWYARIGKLIGCNFFDVYCMVKVDGLALSLVYDDGILNVAATRGDGQVGEDVTANIKTIEAVPLRLAKPVRGRVEVRGEVFMYEEAFKRLNAAQRRRGEPEFANPRNVTAGSVRQLDSKITASRELSFFAWKLMTDLGQKKHSEEWKLLQDLGFKVNKEAALARAPGDVHAYFKRMEGRRKKLGYWIDGVVVRVDDNRAFNRLGVVGKTPRGIIAWKFPAEEVTTTVEDVRWYVGRTGALTPVAVVKPTWIGGTTVSHATLHNSDEIERLGLKIGDTVILVKAGEIIPKITKVLKELRPRGAREIHPPRQCPVCKEPVRRVEGEVAIVCASKRCPAKQLEAMTYFVSKKAMDIDGLGGKIMEQLMASGLVKRPGDIYRLKKDDLVPLERFGEKSADKLLDAIQTSTTVSLSRFIFALGITHVGEETAADVAARFGTLARFRKASKDDLIAIPGIGEAVAGALTDWLASDDHQRLLDDLLEAGVHVTAIERPKHQPLAGMSIVFTGELEAMSRDEAKDKVRALGADPSELVSKKTSLVVAGPGAGSKLDKARKLGVKIIDEKEFLKLIA